MIRRPRRAGSPTRHPRWGAGPMTTSELKRAMDRRFERVERRFEQLERAMDRRFERLDRTKVDKAEFRKTIERLRGEIAASAAKTREYMDRRLRDEIAASAAQTCEYMD